MTDTFSELSEDEKRAYLRALQQAQLELASGARVAKASYSQAGNFKSVDYTQADQGRISALITQLQISLGMRCRRRAIGFRI